LAGDDLAPVVEVVIVLVSADVDRSEGDAGVVLEIL